MNVPLDWYLTLSALLFCIGLFGLLTRRDAIVLFMCVELMLNSVNLTFVAFSQLHGTLDGQVAVVFVMVVAAAEAAIGLAIMLSFFRSQKTLDTGVARELRF